MAQDLLAHRSCSRCCLQTVLAQARPNHRTQQSPNAPRSPPSCPVHQGLLLPRGSNLLAASLGSAFAPRPSSPCSPSSLPSSAPCSCSAVSPDSDCVSGFLGSDSASYCSPLGFGFASHDFGFSSSCPTLSRPCWTSNHPCLSPCPPLVFPSRPSTSPSPLAFHPLLTFLTPLSSCLSAASHPLCPMGQQLVGCPPGKSEFTFLSFAFRLNWVAFWAM